MSEKEKLYISPNICAWHDEDDLMYRIDIEMPGADKDSIVLKMHEDSYFVKGESEDTIYIGSYLVCCEVQPEKAKAIYKNGLLKVEVPFKEAPKLQTIEVTIE